MYDMYESDASSLSQIHMYNCNSSSMISHVRWLCFPSNQSRGCFLFTISRGFSCKIPTQSPHQIPSNPHEIPSNSHQIFLYDYIPLSPSKSHGNVHHPSRPSQSSRFPWPEQQRLQFTEQASSSNSSSQVRDATETWARGPASRLEDRQW